MKAIVTGSNGFIGRYIVDKLKSEGYYVIGIGTTISSNSVVDEYLQCDILTNCLLDMKCLNACSGADVIVHAAASKSMNNFDYTVVNINLIGTLNVLQLAIKIGCNNIVYISSAPVIGKPSQNIIGNNMKEKPKTLYHITKLAGENVFSLPEAKQIRTCILRVPSPIGVGMPNTFLSVIIDKAISNEDIVLLGKGTREQNYIDVRDISKAVYDCVKNQAEGCYYIGSEMPISNTELAKLCINLLNSRSLIKYSDAPDTSDDETWRLDLSAAKEDFGFYTQYSIADTIFWIYGDRKI